MRRVVPGNDGADRVPIEGDVASRDDQDAHTASPAAEQTLRPRSGGDVERDRYRLFGMALTVRPPRRYGRQEIAQETVGHDRSPLHHARPQQQICGRVEKAR